MYHHSSADYRTAASEAGRRGREKMEAIIERGRESAERVVGEIQERCITDKVVPARFVTLSGGGELGLGGELHPLHSHAYGQLLADAGVPKKYADYLEGQSKDSDWGHRLLADNVNQILAHRDKQRNLVRIEGGEDGTVKGWLSDRFRRLDSRPLVDAFIGACQEYGMVPVEGLASDTKCRVRAVLPHVFEPVESEVMIFGAEFGNSDYGDGGLVVNLWTMRVWCTNLAVAEKCLRQVHLGGRLPDDVRFSDETYRRDALATASAVRDITGGVIAPERINRMLSAISEASEQDVRNMGGIDKILARSLDKGEVAAVGALYNGPDVVNLPAGDTVWRLSNAVSWFAQNKGVSPDRRMELQAVAGQLVAGENKGVREV